MPDSINWNTCPMDISDEDVLEAMKSISGFLDITPGDFKEIYQVAFRHSFERLNKAVKAGHIMTRDVIFVLEDTSLLETAELLARHGISGLPVLDSNARVVGVISEKDFLFEMGGRESRSFMGVVFQLMKDRDCAVEALAEKKAADMMTRPPVTVRAGDSVHDIALLFDGKKINRVPVVDGDQKLLGIVTRSDIVQSCCMRPAEQGV